MKGFNGTARESLTQAPTILVYKRALLPLLVSASTLTMESFGADACLGIRDKGSAFVMPETAS